MKTFGFFGFLTYLEEKTLRIEEQNPLLKICLAGMDALPVAQNAGMVVLPVTQKRAPRRHQKSQKMFNFFIQKFPVENLPRLKCCTASKSGCNIYII
jgi:hypothetical protein